MQAQRDAPPDMQCKDKFLVQSVIVNQGVSARDITPEMVLMHTGLSKIFRLEFGISVRFRDWFIELGFL